MNDLAAPRQGPMAQFDPAQVELIKRNICQGATDDELQLFLRQCRQTGLDPFSRQIYSIKRREKQGERWVDRRSTQVSIDGLRLVAERTGKYAGQTAPEWCGADGVWRDVWLTATPPVASRVGVLRRDFEQPCFGIARYAAYVQTGQGDQPTKMWRVMPDVMLAKCAEALALRKAFPQDLSGLYSSEEMAQADDAPAVYSPSQAPLKPAKWVNANASLPPPEQGVYDPETGEVLPPEKFEPHTIAVPMNDNGVLRWIDWGTEFVGHLQRAEGLIEVENWVTFNSDKLESCAAMSPRVHARLEAQLVLARDRFAVAADPAPDLIPAEAEAEKADA